MMEVQVLLNGEAHCVPEACDLASLIASLSLGNQAIAVAVNRQIIRRAQWQEHIVQAGDQVDVVRAIGGG